MPAEVNMDTVDVVEIDQFEYGRLKMLNLSTPEAIIDEFLATLISEGII